MNRFFCNGKQDFCTKGGGERFCHDCEFVNGMGGRYIEVEEAANNPYWERICKLADRQRAKGIEKYGKGLEANTASILARIQHLQEELIDGLMYCEWLKDYLMERENHDQE